MIGTGSGSGMASARVQGTAGRTNPVVIQEGDQSILLRTMRVKVVTAASAGGLEAELTDFLREKAERILLQPIQMGVAGEAGVEGDPEAPSDPEAPPPEEEGGGGNWWALVVYTE